MSRRTPFCSVVALSALAAFAAAAGVARATSIDDFCKQAEREPPLMWYSSQDPALNEITVKAFRSAYPNVRVGSFRLASGALAARYASERDAGVINAGLISLADPAFAKRGLEKKWFVEFDKRDLPALAALDDKFFSRGIASTGINVIGITYNTDIVAGKPPKEWKDLLRSEYKGRIALADPRNVPSFLDVMRILRTEYGDGFLKDLAKQQLVVVSSAVPGTQQMAAGEFAIVFPNTMAVSEPVKRQGGPVDVVIPSVTTGVEYSTMLSSGSASPNGAKCFYNFLFTREGQAGFNSTTGVSPVYDMAKLPAGYRPLDALAALEMRSEIMSLLQLQ